MIKEIKDQEQTKALKEIAGTEVVFQIPDTESIGRLKNMTPDFSLTMRYKSADDWAMLKGQELRAFYMGTKDVPNDKGELVRCAMFITEHEPFIAGQLILVEAVKMLSYKTPVAITYLGKKDNRTSEGSTMMFDVKILS